MSRRAYDEAMRGVEALDRQVQMYERRLERDPRNNLVREARDEALQEREALLAPFADRIRRMEDLDDPGSESESDYGLVDAEVDEQPMVEVVPDDWEPDNADDLPSSLSRTRSLRSSPEPYDIDDEREPGEPNTKDYRLQRSIDAAKRRLVNDDLPAGLRRHIENMLQEDEDKFYRMRQDQRVVRQDSDEFVLPAMGGLESRGSKPRAPRAQPSARQTRDPRGAQASSPTKRPPPLAANPTPRSLLAKPPRTRRTRQMPSLLATNPTPRRQSLPPRDPRTGRFLKRK